MKSFTDRFIIRQDDLVLPEIQELLAETERRILLLIKTRWVFIGILILYSLFALLFYKVSGLFYVVERNYLVPTAAFLAMVAYNSWYHATYKWFSRFRGINLAQLVVDVIFITLLTHYSGGILSWAWALYPLLVIEAAFLLEDRQDTLAITLLCILLYGGLLLAEHYGYLASITVPSLYEIDQNISYKMLFISWFAFIILCFAFIGIYLMGRIRQEEQEMEKQVVIDGLTNLYNRNYFFYRLHSEIARCRRFGHKVSLLLLDLDGFKDINDKLGHLEGDALLQKVAEIFRGNIRRSDTEPAYDIDVPCRYGGDEFCIILPETEEVQAFGVAERIRAAVNAGCKRFLREHTNESGSPPAVTISVGVAAYPAHGDNSEELVKKADEALYKAKAEGKNRVIMAAADDDR